MFVSFPTGGGKGLGYELATVSVRSFSRGYLEVECPSYLSPIALMSRNAEVVWCILNFADVAEPRNRPPVPRPFSPFWGRVWARD